MKQEQEYRQPMPGSVFTAQDELLMQKVHQILEKYPKKAIEIAAKEVENH